MAASAAAATGGKNRITKYLLKSWFYLLVKPEGILYEYQDIADTRNLADSLVSEISDPRKIQVGLIFKGSSQLRGKTVNSYNFDIDSDYKGIILVLLAFNETITSCIGFDICYGNAFNGKKQKLVKMKNISQFSSVYNKFLADAFDHFHKTNYTINHPELTIISMQQVIIKTLENKKNNAHPLADINSKKTFIEMAREDGRVKCLKVSGQSRQDVLVCLVGHEDKMVGVQLKSSRPSKKDGSYKLGRTKGYDDQFLVGMAFDENYENCMYIEYWLGYTITADTKRMTNNKTSDKKKLFDYIVEQITFSMDYSFCNCLRFMTMEEAERDLGLTDLEEFLTRDHFKSCCPFLTIENFEIEGSISDFSTKIQIGDELVDSNIQQKSLYINPSGFGFRSTIKRKIDSKPISYSLEDKVNCYLFASKTNAKDFFYLLTALEMYLNDKITLRVDINGLSTSINFYPPGTSVSQTGGPKRDEWANDYYFEYNDVDLEKKVKAKLEQSYKEREEIRRRLAQ